MTSLVGRRILLVEDEAMVAMLIESILIGENCIVIGPYATLAEAVAAARNENPDAALLDVNLGGDWIFPAIEILEERGIPFLLLTGYGKQVLPENRHWPVCAKPFRIPALLQALRNTMDRGKTGVPPPSSKPQDDGAQP
jgi:DNA-binding response OmpR family regulator